MNKNIAIELGLLEVVDAENAAETSAELLRQAADLDAKATALEAFNKDFEAACARLEAVYGDMSYARYCIRQAFDAGFEAHVLREWAEEARREADNPSPKNLRVHKRRIRY